MNKLRIIFITLTMTLLFCSLVGWQYSKVEKIDHKNTKLVKDNRKEANVISKVSFQFKDYSKYLSTKILASVDEVKEFISKREEQKAKINNRNNSTDQALTSANTSPNSTDKEGTFIEVPIISQLPELPSGCEITAVAMMLQYKGVNVDKLTLANEMPKHSSNPNLGYVGDPFKTTGYTINPPALMDLMNKYAGSAVDLTGSDPTILENYLQSKKPVVVWMDMYGYKVHAVTLCGFNDKKFYYNDPLTGWKRVAMDKESFLAKWNAKNRMALSY